MELSVVIITFNEERNIARCITSVKELCEEVIVVDSGSTDTTVSIAQRLGASVTHRAWTNYSDQKNHANDLAKGGHILSLDADEAVSTALRSSILKARGKGLKGAYSMHRLTNYCGTWVRHGGWYPDTKVRLFPKGGARWTGEHVHERLKIDPSVPVTLLQGDLHHYSFYSVPEHERQAERFARLAAQGLHAQGKTSGLMQRFFSPLSRFIQGYVLRGGFLDGRAGLTIARISARAKRIKYTELIRLNRQQA